jgi:uncharacterized protein (TIGR02996 family)
MAGGEAFLQAVLANPDDIPLRLVYADWLEEHGQDGRAEFIRVQCELAELEARMRYCPAAALEPLVDRHAGLKRREWELLGQPGRPEAAWAQPLWGLWQRGCPVNWIFRRGFVEVVWLPADDWRGHGAAILALQPVGEAVVRKCDWNTHVADAEFLALCRRLEKLTFADPLNFPLDLPPDHWHVALPDVKIVLRSAPEFDWPEEELGEDF